VDLAGLVWLFHLRYEIDEQSSRKLGMIHEGNSCENGFEKRDTARNLRESVILMMLVMDFGILRGRGGSCGYGARKFFRI